MSSENGSEQTITVGRITINLSKKTLSAGARTIKVRAKLMAVLWFFGRQVDQNILNSELADMFWSMQYIADSHHSARGAVSSIRRLLEKLGCGKYLTSTGNQKIRGYILAVPNPDTEEIE